MLQNFFSAICGIICAILKIKQNEVEFTSLSLVVICYYEKEVKNFIFWELFGTSQSITSRCGVKINSKSIIKLKIVDCQVWLRF